MKKLFTIIILIFSLLFVNVSVFAEKYYSENAVCVENRAKGNTTAFYIENLLFSPLTIKISFDKLENMKADVELPYTVVVLGKSKQKAFSINPINLNKRYNYYFRYNWHLGSKDAVHDDTVVYMLPYSSKKKFQIIQGYNSTFSHYGQEQYSLDWDMPEGTPLLASRGGIVVMTEGKFNEHGTDKDYYTNRGNYIRILHDDGTIGEYYHFKYKGVKVKIGEKVKAGQLIGYSGNTGYSTCPHLHFDVFKAKDAYKKETIPVKFKTKSGKIITLKEGSVY
jgi:murein DD-endopeptidase MepM/ murein hydrolase activator NlpD